MKSFINVYIWSQIMLDFSVAGVVHVLKMRVKGWSKKKNEARVGSYGWRGRQNNGRGDTYVLVCDTGNALLYTAKGNGGCRWTWSC